MTTCAECLSTVSNIRLADLRPGSEIALHCATCPDCWHAVEEIRVAEYRLATALSEQRPTTNPSLLAAAVILESHRRRRRRIAQWLRGGLAVAACGVFGIFMETRMDQVDPELNPNLNPPGRAAPAGSQVIVTHPDEIITETIALTCLTPAEAAEIATPYLRSDGTAVYRQDALRLITLRGIVAEFLAAKAEIERFDKSDRCRLPGAKGTPAPNPSDETPKKD